MKVTKTTKVMTIDEIRTEADNAGFTPVTFERDNTKYIKMAFCKKCQKDKMLVFTAKEKGGKYHTARACPCGYREMFGYGIDPKSKKKVKEDMRTKSSKCGWEGDQCWHWLQGGDSECKRTKCVAYGKKKNSTKFPSYDKTCKNNTCMNPVPQKNRKYCTTCRPPRTKKEAVSSNFPM